MKVLFAVWIIRMIGRPAWCVLVFFPRLFRVHVRFYKSWINIQTLQFENEKLLANPRLPTGRKTRIDSDKFFLYCDKYMGWLQIKFDIERVGGQISIVKEQTFRALTKGLRSIPNVSMSHSIWRRTHARTVSFAISLRGKCDPHQLVWNHVLLFYFPPTRYHTFFWN